MRRRARENQPAFPRAPGATPEVSHEKPGMTLEDYFAGQSPRRHGPPRARRQRASHRHVVDERGRLQLDREARKQ